MPGSEEKNKKISQSLFDQGIVGTDDILHSVEVVQSYWAQEKARRRRLALIIFVPISLVVIFSYLAAARHYKFFPFVDKPAWLTAPNVPDAGLPDQIVSQTEGNPDALIKIVVTHPEDSGLESQAQKVLHEALDLKPSEFYVQYRITDKLPKAERENLHAHEGHSITINEQSKFVFGNPERPDRVIELLGFCPIFYTPQDLVEAVNHVYREVYGKEGQPPLLDLKALGLEPGGDDDDGSQPDTLPKIGVEGDTQGDSEGDIRLRLPTIKIEE